MRRAWTVSQAVVAATWCFRSKRPQRTKSCLSLSVFCVLSYVHTLTMLDILRTGVWKGSVLLTFVLQLKGLADAAGFVLFFFFLISTAFVVFFLPSPFFFLRIPTEPHFKQTSQGGCVDTKKKLLPSLSS